MGKLLTLLDLLLLHRHLCRCLLCSQVGRCCEDPLVQSQATYTASHQNQTIRGIYGLDKLSQRTSPSGLKALALVPVGLSTASDESSASTTCNITDDPNLRFEAYITRGNVMSSKYTQKIE